MIARATRLTTETTYRVVVRRNDGSEEASFTPGGVCIGCVCNADARTKSADTRWTAEHAMIEVAE